MSLSEIKTNRSFVDALFDFKNSNTLELSVQIGLDGLYLAVFDAQKNTFVGVKEYIFDGYQSLFQVKEEFEKLAQTEIFFQHQYQKQTVAIVDKNALLIPDALFEEERLNDYLKFTNDFSEDDQALVDSLINTKAKNVYGVPKFLLESIQKFLPKASLLHYASPLIEGLAAKYKRNDGGQLALHIQYSHLEVLYFMDGALQFNNTFKYTTSEDIVYYVMFVLEQLNLNAEKVAVDVFGELDEHTGAYDLIGQYIRNVRFGSRNDLVKYAEILDVVPPHFYFNLFQQYMCA